MLKKIGVSVFVCVVFFLIYALFLHKENINKPIEPPVLNIPKTCELGKEYVFDALAERCDCPQGYQLYTSGMTWGRCPKEGMHDCPASIVICKEI